MRPIANGRHDRCQERGIKVAKHAEHLLPFEFEVSAAGVARHQIGRVQQAQPGPGIPAADLARVTEPFVRLDAARRLDTGGVGLGLAIVRDAAAYHGGTLVLENRVGGGLRAMLDLPRAK
ncbi:MAG: ATP-binding protein [Burkholderiales bacterium]